MGSLSVSVLLTCLSVVIRSIDSHSNIPGRCDFVNYCAHLRQAQINPIGHHPATCPDPTICDREIEFFQKKPQRKIKLKVIPSDEMGYSTVKMFSGCQLQPHCGRIPVKRPTTQLWPAAKYRVPVRCNFVDYCDSLRQYNFHPIGTHPGVCPDPTICGREVESFVRRKESKIPLQVFPTEDPYTCKTCARRPPKMRKAPQYIAFVPGPDTDHLPGTCADLLHCGRVPQRDSRPASTSSPNDGHPGAERFPQRGG